MKTALGFLTEEGRTRSKNAARRISAYAVVMFLVAGFAGYAIHAYWVANSLTTLQRIYFKQYLKSTYRSFLPHSRSHYTTLARVITDPTTNGAISRRFTSYDRGASSNLDYAVNRFYDSTQGRFTQVDPIKMNSASLVNPQSLNLFAYCTNDPVNHTDPQGLNGWVFVSNWPPWGYPPPSGGTAGASFWALLSSFLHGFMGSVFSFGIPGYYVPPALQQTFVSLSATHGLLQRGKTNQITARQPTPAELDFDAAARAVGAILSQNKGINACNQFFNGAGLGALEAITNAVHNSNGQAFQGISGNSSTGIRMSSPTSMSFRDAPIMPEVGRYVAVAPLSVTANLNGPFVLQFPNGRGNGGLPNIGGYPPDRLRSRVLQLLHEMGHLTITRLGLTRTTFNQGGRRRTFLMRSLIPLLPFDGRSDQEGLSSSNTDTVLDRCRNQINLLPR